MVIEKSYGAPRITKDGVTVAKEIEFTDKSENLGAQLIREVATKTSDLAGDGATTAVAAGIIDPTKVVRIALQNAGWLFRPGLQATCQRRTLFPPRGTRLLFTNVHNNQQCGGCNVSFHGPLAVYWRLD